MKTKNAASVLALLCAACAALAQAPAPRLQRDLKVEKDAPPPVQAAAPGIPRSYALIVGIAKYANLEDRFQLHFTEGDADAIYSILISPEGGNFPAENVHRLMGSKATLANLRRELEEWLPSVVQDQDRVLIYFAGHGFLAGGRGYLAPYDFDLKNPEKSGYPMDTLGSVIANLKAKWKVMLTDACHSGAIAPEESEQLNRRIRNLNASLFSLTASRDREQSLESADWGGGHGIFTYYLVKGLEGSADENGDGMVTADELGEYVRRNVREATKTAQNPTFERASFDPNMLLAYNPTGVKSASAPPPKEGALIIEVNMDGTEVFVDGKSAGVVNKGAPLRLPGLTPGAHTVKAVRMGYEPVGPREEIVYPGQERTITIRIFAVRRQKRAAEDLFDQGMEKYERAKGAGDYREAVKLLEKALAAEPNYSQAALYLARSQRALFEDENAEKCYRRAIEIDPDYLEARADFAGMLLEMDNADEAIRQLNVVLQRDRKHDRAYYYLAQAFRMKDRYKEAIEAARSSIKLAPDNPDAHFWLAESLRLSGDHAGAVPEYNLYLSKSDFDSKLLGKVGFYVLGFLANRKKSRGGQTDIWKEMRGMAYFGLCDSERNLGRFDQAIGYCQRSLSFDPQDPYVHYALALCLAGKGNESGEAGMFSAARKHFQVVVTINPDMAEAAYAKRNIAGIDALLAAR